MKTIIFLAIAAVATAAPQFGNDQFERDFIRIISDTRSAPVDGNYRFDFETDNGIVRSESGSNGLNGGSAQQGSWRVVYPDGSAGEFSFVADDQGARFESPLLPIGPEIPQHALEQIAFAEEERRQGIFHDGSWDEATYGAANF